MAVLWDKWRIFLIKWDSRAGHHEVARKTGSLSKSILGLCYQNISYETSSLNLTSRKIIFRLLLKAYFKNRLYFKAPDVEGFFCQIFLILRTCERKNLYFWDQLELIAKKRLKRHLWMHTSSAKTKLNRLDVGGTVMWKIPLSFFLLHHSMYCTAWWPFPTFWTFFDLAAGLLIVKHVVCRRKKVFISGTLCVPCTFRFLESDVSHFRCCGFQPLSHYARWLKVGIICLKLKELTCACLRVA